MNLGYPKLENKDQEIHSNVFVTPISMQQFHIFRGPPKFLRFMTCQKIDILSTCETQTLWVCARQFPGMSL